MRERTGHERQGTPFTVMMDRRFRDRATPEKSAWRRQFYRVNRALVLVLDQA